MPIREFRCGKCGNRWDEIFLSQEEEEDYVPYCKQCKNKEEVSQAQTIPAIIFKGEGWESNDKRARSVVHDPYDCVGADGNPCDVKTGKPL